MMEIYWNAVVFIFGAITGSFLNVCIYRLPRDLSVSNPKRSYCPHCRKTIPWYYNLPLISWLALAGKCKFCKKPIAFRYFAVELLTALLFVFIWNLTGFNPLHFTVKAVFIAMLLVIVFTDFETKLIPDWISLPGIVLGLISSLVPNLLFPQEMWYYRLAQSALGAVTGYGLLFATAIFGNFVFKKDSMGGGDLKLMAMMGAFIGWLNILYVFLLAPFVALPFALWYKAAKRSEQIPFGPFLALWGALFCLYGDFVTDLLAKFYGV